jgi:hypothetical protein
MSRPAVESASTAIAVLEGAELAILIPGILKSMLDIAIMM